VTKLPNKIRAAARTSPAPEFRIDEVEVKNGKTAMLMKDATLIPEGDVFPGTAKVSGSALVDRDASFEERADTASKTVVWPDHSRRPAGTMRRWWGESSSPMPNILIVAADGTELRRLNASEARTPPSLLDEITTGDIAAIEVYKGNTCQATPMSCPLIKITIKAGREAKYRPR
jgi:hypothetical protein